MMKTFLGLTTMLAVAGSATAAPVTGWVQIFDGQTPSTGLTDAGTNSPTLGDADAASMAANFASVTLADGESITLSGSVTIDNDLAGDQFRLGLFDGDDPVAAGDGDGYEGFYADAPIGTSTAAGINYGSGATVGVVHPFTSGDATLLGTIPGPGLGIGVPGGQALDFVFTITRDDAGGGLDFSVSLTSGADYSTSLAVEDAAYSNYTFDSVAFLVGGSQDGTSAAFSNIDVTVVPEPGSLALIGLGGFVMLRRRRA